MTGKSMARSWATRIRNAPYDGIPALSDGIKGLSFQRSAPFPRIAEPDSCLYKSYMKVIGCLPMSEQVAV